MLHASLVFQNFAGSNKFAYLPDEDEQFPETE
jgi:hypothetical protein